MSQSVASLISDLFSEVTKPSVREKRCAQCDKEGRKDEYRIFEYLNKHW